MKSGVSSPTTDRIYVSTGAGIANLTLNDVKINVSSTDSTCAFNVASAGLNLTLSGENELWSGKFFSGLHLMNFAKLTIDTGAQEGKLTAVANESSAGIGAGDGSQAGDITILGGNIVAYGFSGGVGIGAGDKSQVGNITILGGNITATGNSGIGSINDGTVVGITILGGNITAMGIGGAVGIGAMNNNDAGNITISGGVVVADASQGSSDYGINGKSVTINGGSVWTTKSISPAPIGLRNDPVFANKLTLAGITGAAKIAAGAVDGVVCSVTPAAINGVYGLRDVYTTSGAVCLWLPDNPSPTAGVVLNAEGKFYGVEGVRNSSSRTATLSPMANPTVAPTNVTFANEPHGYSAVTPQDITITNNKSGVAFPSVDVTVSTYNYAITKPFPGTLPNGQTATVSVRPNTLLPVGEHTATLTVKSMGITVGTVPLSFRVVDSHAWTTSPKEIDFGVRPLKYSAGAFSIFEFKNTGTGNITNVDVRLTGANEAGFEVRRETPRAVVAPGERRSLSVRPMTDLPAGTYSATITLTSKEVATVSVPVKFTVASFGITGAGDGDKFIYKASGKGNTVQLGAVLTPANMSDGQIAWRSSNRSIASVDENGLVTFIGTEGKVKITASLSGKFAASADVTLESVSNVTSFNTPLKSIYLQRGKSMTIPIKLTDSTAPNVEVKSKLKWKSSKPSVVAVTASGKITANKNVKKTTAATVTVTAANGASLRIKVTVVPKAVKLKSVSATLPKSMKAGRSYQIAVRLKDAKATGVSLTFKSSKQGVLKVNNAGKLFALKKGSAKITVKAGGKQYSKTVKVG
ncbi:MAG: Ig-like domain-containing protein [Clostridiales Family XIII bacterium]|nr:Ig-like domain-containing protein [Clostridiales Family XIII bacterium]